MKPNIERLSLIIIFVAFAFMASLAYAGGPAGHPSTLDKKVKDVLQYSLSTEGYNENNLSHNISAYLWDNRRYLRTRVRGNKVPRQRKVDLVICLLMNKEGNDRLRARYSKRRYRGFKRWCQDNVRATPYWSN